MSAERDTSSGRAVRWSVLASVSEKYASQAIMIVTLAIMSRILTPAETGLYLLSNTITMLLENLRVFGVGIYIVQEKTLTRHILRSVFTFSLLMSLAVIAVICLSAGGIASYFRQPELAPLLRIAVIAFLVAPFGNPVIALLQRELAFGPLSVISVVASVLGAGLTIGLGLAGLGAASYVWGFVATSVTTTVLAIAYRPDMGIYRLTLRGAGRVLSFGSVSAGVTLLNMLNDNLPRIALARLLGMDAVGVYGRTVTICQLPDRALASAVQPVVLPTLAARARSGGDLKTTYLGGHALMSGFQWPTLIVLALLADPVVRLLLGPQWGESPPLVRLMAIAYMATAPAFMTFPVLVASGRIRDTLYASLISLPPSAAVVIVAATVSLKAVAVSLLFLAPMQMLVALWFIRRAIGMSWQELARASARSLLVTLGAAAVPALIVLLSPRGFDLGPWETVCAIAGAAAGWGVAVRLCRHPILAEAQMIWQMLQPLTARFRRFAPSPKIGQ
ncbi:oligosaccharide flippase family protein (plasmid) [Salipiger sp. H15]|uniref:Oligosaccharide flippase family protein n=1 Tax=Alloyangia sp. H15 TaxID=3029062 RepID=A0AAU8AR26_9RHOB